MAETPTIEGSVKARTQRTSARLRVESLMYLSLGSENGGFPINLSEEGMAFQGIRPLQKDQEICVTFKLDGVDEPVTAAARIVWLTESCKAGALQFVDMPDASRQKIRQWIELQKKAQSPQHSADLDISPLKQPRGAVKAPVAAASKPPAIAPQKPQSPIAAATPVVNLSRGTVSPKPAPVSSEIDAPVVPILASISVPSAEPVPTATNSCAPVAAAPVTQEPSPVQASTPVLLMPEFAPAPAPPAREPVQAGRSNITVVVPKAEIEVKKSAALQAAPDSASAQQAVWVAMPPRRKKKSGLSFSFTAVLAASIGIAGACGVLLWPYHTTLLQRFQGNTVAKAVSPAPAPAPAQAEDAPAAEAPVNLPMKDPSQLAPLADALETQPAAPAVPAVNVSMSAPAVPAVPSSRVKSAKSSATAAPPSNSKKAAIAPAPISSSLHPTPPAVTLPARNRILGVAAPAVSSSEGANDLPGAGAKVPLLETKAPASPITVIGSVEIVPDPYPSIRKPAGPQQGPSSKLGASLQLGRLTSKVDPVYPQEALRQKIAGSVKVRVVIGKTGTVESAEMVDGPAQLAESAVRAIEQWRYEPTLVGGTAVEVDENVTLVFRVASIAPPAN